MDSRGATLVEIIVVGVISSIMLVGFLRLFSTSFSAQKHLETRSDLESIRRVILESVDCDASLSEAGINPVSPGTNCASTSAAGDQKAPFMRLRRRNISGAVSYIGTKDLDADGSFGLGQWRVRASCSASEQSLVIRAAKPTGPSTFEIDPLTKQPLSWDNARALLFGVGGPNNAIPICFVNTALHVTLTSSLGNFSAACNAYQKLQFNTASPASNNLYDTSTHRFTLPTGRWLVSLTVNETGYPFYNSVLKAGVYKNGSVLRWGSEGNSYQNQIGAHLSTVIESTSPTDYYEFYVTYQNCLSATTMFGVPNLYWAQITALR